MFYNSSGSRQVQELLFGCVEVQSQVTNAVLGTFLRDDMPVMHRTYLPSVILVHGSSCTYLSILVFVCRYVCTSAGVS